MNEKTFEIPAISCDHCVHAIRTELDRVVGVQRVDADRKRKLVTVAWEPPADEAEIVALLTEIGYPPA